MAYFQYHKSYDVFGLNTIKIWETIPSPMTFSTNLPCENSLFEWPSKAISPTRITLYVRRYSRSETTASGLNLIAATEMILSVSKLKSFFSQTGLYNSPSLRCSQAVVNPPPASSCSSFVSIQQALANDWEQRKLGELYEKAGRKNSGEYGGESIISVANMRFSPADRELAEGYLETYNVMDLGDIAFEGNRSKHFAHGRFVENDIGPGIVSHVFDVFRPKTQYDLAYWKYAINNERVMGAILVRSTKASTMMHNLVAADFLKESMPVPTVPEQSLIGALFAKLDSLITLHQRERFADLDET